MTDQTRDEQCALSTATIFDESIFLSEALNLPVNQHEEDVDAELALLARESGIQDPYRYLPPREISRALSTVTLDSDHSSSMSIHSQETQSTSFTSAPSRTSRDHVSTNDRSPAQRPTPRPARASNSIDGHETAATTTPTFVTPNFSELTPSVAPSLVSDGSSASSSATAPRRKRGSIFGMFRKDSSSCTSRSHLVLYGKGKGPKLDCGHALSHYAIRVHIQEALQKGGQAAPSCCGVVLPRHVLEEVLAREEADLVTHSAPQLSGTGSSRDSGYCERIVESPSFTPNPQEKSPPPTATSQGNTAPHQRIEAISIDSALASEAFKSFRIQEKEQFERVASFESHQRQALSAILQATLKRLQGQHEAGKLHRIERHAQDLEHLEELQIIAEHDLRTAHDMESQNVATALKHMEAYCLGSRDFDPDHPHVVTEEDFKKLDRQRATQQNLPRKHENAINVLRARQEREMRNRLQKHETELETMDQDLVKKKATEETEYKTDMEKLNNIIDTRRKRILQRWDLRFEMWRQDWEEQHGTPFSGQLEHESWPTSTVNPTNPIPASSSLAPFLKAAA